LGYLVNKVGSAAKICIKIRFPNGISTKKRLFSGSIIYFWMNFFHISIILLILAPESEN